MNPSWQAQAISRFRLLWLCKAAGTTVAMVLFFWCYFYILEHQPRTPWVVPATQVDAWVPFTQWAFFPYVSLWVYVSLPPAFMGNFKTLLQFGAWVSAMCATGLMIFWWFPSQTPNMGIDWTQYPMLGIIKKVDAPGNVFPSLHVASAVFSASWLQRVFKELGAPPWLGWISALHCLAIVWSTVALRQHVALDVFAGAALGLLFAAASLHHTRRMA